LLGTRWPWTSPSVIIMIRFFSPLHEVRVIPLFFPASSVTIELVPLSFFVRKDRKAGSSLKTEPFAQQLGDFVTVSVPMDPRNFLPSCRKRSEFLLTPLSSEAFTRLLRSERSSPSDTDARQCFLPASRRNPGSPPSPSEIFCFERTAEAFSQWFRNLAGLLLSSCLLRVAGSPHLFFLPWVVVIGFFFP